MTIFMPKIEESWYTQEEWDTWMKQLIDHQGLLKTHKPIYYHSKNALIIESVFIHLIEYLFRHPKYTVPFYSYSDRFYNQVEQKKMMFSLEEHIEITQISWSLIRKTLNQLKM